MGIVHENVVSIADDSSQLNPGDEAYFIADRKDVHRILAIFGQEESEARHVLIAGASDTALYVAEELTKRHRHNRVKMIEEDAEKCKHAADILKRTVVLNGSPLDAALLREAGIGERETFLALSEDDEENIMSSLLAKKEGAGRTICTYNNMAYRPLMQAMEVDAYLSPREITISSILRYIRMGKIMNLHALHDGDAEVIEAQVLETSAMAGHKIEEVEIPEGSRFLGIWRDEKFLTPEKNLKIQSGDHVFFFALAGKAPALEKLFSVSASFF